MSGSPDEERQSVDLRAEIRRVIGELGWKCLEEEDVNEAEVVCIFGTPDLGNWVLITRILQEQRDVLLIATTQENIPAQARAAIVDFITRANFGILCGFFDLDIEDGDLRFSARMHSRFMQLEQFRENFKKTFQIVHGTFSKYLPGIVLVVQKGMSGKSAVEMVEGGAGILPDKNHRPLLYAAAKHLFDAKTKYICHPQKGLIRMPCTVQGITLQLKIKVLEDSKNIYVFCSYPTKRNSKEEAAIRAKTEQLIEFVCRANWNLPFGYFDFDIDQGDFRFVCWIPLENLTPETVQNECMRTLIVCSITTFMKYYPGIDEIILENKKPSAVIDAIDGLSTSKLSESGSFSLQSNDKMKKKVEADGDSEDKPNLLDSESLVLSTKNISKGHTFHTSTISSTNLNQSKPSFYRSQPVSIIIDLCLVRRISLLPCVTNELNQVGILNYLSLQLKDKSLSTFHGAIAYNLSDVNQSLNNSKAIKRVLNRCNDNPDYIILAPHQDSYLSVSLSVLVNITHFEMNVGDQFESEISWSLESSYDGIQWKVLRNYGPSKAQSGEVDIWKVPYCRSALCKHIRIRNISESPLQISMFELYGYLYVENSGRGAEQMKMDESILTKHVDALRTDVSDIETFDAKNHKLLSPFQLYRTFVGKFLGLKSVFRYVYNEGYTLLQKSRFEMEVASRSLLSCENMEFFPQIYGFVRDEPNSQWIIIEEFFSDISLLDLFKRESEIQELTMMHRIRIAISIVRALHELHSQQVIHGNLCPSNILIKNKGDHFEVQLVGFGYSKYIIPIISLELTSSLIHNPIFIAPEILIGSDSGSFATDIYSLSLVLYWLLTAKCPFYTAESATNISTIYRVIFLGLRPEFPSKSIPDEIAQLISLMWDPIPNVRPNTELILNKFLTFNY